MAEQTQRRAVSFAATLGLTVTAGLVIVTAAPALADIHVDDTTQCVAGTFHVGHGVTQVHVHAIGAAGEDGSDVTQNIAGGTVDWQGGTGGLGTDIETTIPVTAGTTLYVGVANDGMPGAPRPPVTQGGGKGGAASWVTDTDPRVNGGCHPSAAHAVVVAAGGGGGGGAGNRHQAHPGGAGGVEADGGNGGRGAEGTTLFDTPEDAGYPGLYSNGTSGGAGGAPGSSPGCSGGKAGAAGTALAGGTGGDPGEEKVGDKDCSDPPPGCAVCAQFLTSPYGGAGGSGGGGLWGGGGGGGADDSGYGAGGGGASGKSYARNPATYAMKSTRIPPFVSIEPLRTPVAITSADHVTFTRGTPGSFVATATGVETPYVRFIGTLPNGVTFTPATFADDGSGAGSATLSGTPSEHGVFPLQVDACNDSGCVPRQPFTLTVNGSPSFTSPDHNVLVIGSVNTVPITTTAYPAATITQSDAPAWLTFTDHHDGTATLAGTPPAGAAGTTVVHLTAANGIGSNATQTLTFKVVVALAITPSTVHLVPNFSNPSTAPYRRGFEQQLRATGTFSDGSAADLTGFVPWSSSDAAVASVSNSALVSAHALGTATINAATAAAPATASVVVAMPLSLTVTPATTSLMGGQTQQLTAVGCYANPCASNSFDITPNVTWSSINSSAQVSADGLATANPGGSFGVIFAELFSSVPGNGYIHGEADITVTHGDVVQVVVTPANATIPTRTVKHYHARLVYQDGTLADDSPYVTWSVSGIATATIGAGAGDAYSPDPGTATVRARFTNAGGGIVDGTTTLHVIRTPSALLVSPVSGSPDTPLVKAGTRQYKALAHYSDGSPDVDVSNGVTWVSTSEANATMSATGLVTALGSVEGQPVVVYAQYTYLDAADDTVAITGNSTVYLTMLPPTSIAITPTTTPVLHPNDDLQFTVTGTYADGSTVNLTNLITGLGPGNDPIYAASWQSTNTFVGTMDTSGRLHVPAGTTHGTLTVSASMVGPGFVVIHSNDVTVTVTDPLDHIALHSFAPGGSPLYLTAGSWTPYSYWVEGFDDHNNSLGNVTAASTIAMSPDGTCDAANQICRAFVADVGASRHTITATNLNAVHPTSPGIQIQILRAATQRIVVTGGSTSITAGQSTAPYHVTSYDTYDNALDVTNLTSFSVSPVEPSSGCDGVPGNSPTCHAATAGQHTVRLSYQGGAFVQLLPLWVNASPVLDHITLSGGPTGPGPHVAVGTTTPKYHVEGYDPFGNHGDITGQTVLHITPDGTCAAEAFTCTPAVAGAHSVTASTVVGASVLTSNALSLYSVAPPTPAVSFTPTVVVQDTPYVDLKFTVTNPNSIRLTGIGWTATVPPSLEAASLTNNTCDTPGFQFSTPVGGFVMSGVALNAGLSCTFTYRALARAAGGFSSTMSGLTSVEGGPSAATATATLTVTGPPVLTKTFVAGSVQIGSTTPLSFTVTNPNTTLALSGIGFVDPLPAGLSFASTTVTGSCGGGTLSIAGGTLSLSGATLAAGAACTFTADVVANTLGSKTNTTSTVTSNERGDGPPAQATVVVTPPVDHFDIVLDTLTAGVTAHLTVTAYDRFNNVVSGYAGTPTLTGDFSASGTGCGPAETDPCDPVYAMAAFVDGVGSADVTAYHEDSLRSVTVHDGAVTTQSSQGLLVLPGAFDHITLTGGSASVPAGTDTLPYAALGWDKYGNLRGNAAFTLSISPEGTCNGADSCRPFVSETDGSHHTITGTNVAALHPTATRSLIVGHGPVEHIEVDGGSRTIAAGATTQPYTVRGFDVFGNNIGDIPVADVTFTIDPSAHGSCDQTARTCTATDRDAPGWYHLVRATYVTGPFADGDHLIVTAGPLDHLVLTPGTATVSGGQYQPYVAIGYDAYGNALGDRTALTTFTIDGGTCTGSSCHASTAAAHTVTGTLGTATGDATLNVTAAHLHHIALLGGSPSILAGTDTAPYHVEGYDAGNNDLGDVTDGATLSMLGGTCDQVAHTCSATSADNGGSQHRVDAIHSGAAGNPAASSFVTVTPGIIDRLVMIGGSPSITAGQSTTPYALSGYDAFDNYLGTVTNDVTLSIDPDGTCNQVTHTCSASVADTGAGHHTVTATHSTVTTVTATSDVVVLDGGGGGGGGGGGVPGVLDHFGFVVHDLTAGDSSTFTVTAYDTDGGVVTDYAGTPTLSSTLGSSTTACGPVGVDPCAPQVYVQGGFVSGVATVSILAFRAETGRTVTATDGSVESTSGTFAVGPTTADHVKLSGGSASVGVGVDTAPYVVEGFDVFGNDAGDVTADSDLSILPLGSCTGAVCSATDVGGHVVLASYPGAQTQQQNLLVTAGPVVSIALFGDETVDAGQSTSPFQVVGIDAYGNDAGDVTNDATLSIGPDGSCDPTDHTCTATIADSDVSVHTVTATLPAAAFPATSELSVGPGPFDHFVLSPDEATIAAGGSQAYTAHGYDLYGNLISYIDENGASFDVDGDPCGGQTCTSTAPGDHTVTGTYEGTPGTAVLHVNAGPLDHITLTGGSTSVDTNVATAAYHVEGWDAYGNDRGDVTGTTPLSITPDGTCNQLAHTCTPTAGDTGGSHHTVTATNSTATHHTATKNLTVNDTGADVRLTKTGPATAVPGTDVTYLLSARNFGPGTATGVTVTDPYPAGTSFVSETHPALWTCTTAGSYVCTRASLTTAAGAQAFTLVLHIAASVTGPVSNTATVTTTSLDPTGSNNTPPAVVATVGCGRTITGLYAGDLTLSGVGTTCLRGATVTGKLTVQKGATLVAVNATVGGAVSTNGSGALSFCGSTLRSSVNIAGAKGFVLFGDPGDDACAGNTVTGSVSVTGSLAGVDVRSNRLMSSLNVDNNKGGGPFPADAAPVVAANVITGRLSCKGNNPAPTNAGQRNTAPSKLYQCASL